MSLTILCDVDGPLAEMHIEWYKLHNRNCMICDKPLHPEDVTEWGAHKFVKCGTRIYEYLWDDHLYDHVKAVPGALNGIATLRTLGHRVIFVTSGLQPGKIKWLRDQDLIDPVLWRSDKDWIIASDKSSIIGDVMIDDHIGNLSTFSGFRILFNATHNQMATAFPRAFDWETIVHMVKAFAQR